MEGFLGSSKVHGIQESHSAVKICLGKSKGSSGQGYLKHGKMAIQLPGTYTRKTWANLYRRDRRLDEFSNGLERMGSGTTPALCPNGFTI